VRRRRRSASLAALTLTIACLAPIAASTSAARAAEALPSGFRDTIAIEGLHDPTAVRFAPNGQVFVAQKDGEILLFDNIDDTTPQVFVDLRPQVYEYGDRGLLGLAIDPAFPARPYVYALYTFDHVLGEDAPGAYPHWHDEDCIAKSGGKVDACPVSGRLVRLTDENDEAVAEKPLVEAWCQQFSSHSIGDLRFGPEGALFASGGEGASFTASDYGQFGWPHKNQCNDPPGGEALKPPSAEGGSLRSQDALTPFDPLAPSDPTGLSGTLIRVDPNTGAGWPGNPMAASQDANERRIIGFGFRNPFRFAIDPRNEEVYVNNVGNGSDEEIDRLPLAPETAYNSGWPCVEGPDRNPGFESLGLALCEKLYDEPGSTQEPFLYYSHGGGVTPEDHCPTNNNGSAITGSAFYEAGAFPPEYDNALFFADSVRGCIYVISADANGDLNPLTTRPFLSDGRPYTGADIEIGPEGDLYYTSLYGDENVHRISYDAHAPIAELTADKQSGALPLKVKLDASGSEDPDGESLKYEWDLNQDGTFEIENGSVTQTAEFKASENAKVVVRVKDQTGKTSTAQLTIYAGDTPPQVKISKPLESLTWEVGQPIQFEGSAKENGGAQISTADLYWRSSVLHCPGGIGACHAHPLAVFPAVDGGELTGPDHDYPSKIKLSLTATDSRGLSATKTIELEPQAAVLQIASDPAGIELTAGTLTGPAPYPLTVIKGANVTLAAPQTAQLAGKTYSFEGWSDGGARVHSLAASGSATYTASYVGPSDQPGARSGRAAGGSQPPLGGVPSGPPRPVLSLHPPRRTVRSAARFEFASPQPGAGYGCKLDDGPLVPCRSPRAYRKLKPGEHVFRVLAEAPGDSVEYSAATVFRWRVLAKRG
jgi:glucose/arabinose dehydrogenase